MSVFTYHDFGGIAAELVYTANGKAEPYRTAERQSRSKFWLGFILDSSGRSLTALQERQSRGYAFLTESILTESILTIVSILLIVSKTFRAKRHRGMAEAQKLKGDSSKRIALERSSRIDG